MTRLLSESQRDIQEAIKSYLCITPPADWNTVQLLEDILKLYAITDVENDLDTFKTCYIAALQSYQQSSIQEKAIAATERLEAVPCILQAPVIKKLFLQQYQESVRETGVIAATTSLLVSATSAVSSNVQNNAQESKPFEDMDPEAKAAFLVDKLGDHGFLDLAVSRVPYRFRDGLKDIRSHFSIPLQPMVTLEERRALLDFAGCTSDDDVDNLLQEMFTRRNTTSNIQYIRSAIDGLQSLWKSNRLRSKNDEGWYRQNVYSYMWDRLFLHNDTFYTKRAECLSAVIKELQGNEQVAQQRSDFILRNLNDGSDYMSSEEKPGHQDIHCDIQKAKRLRNHMLQLWRNKLGSIALAKQLEAITCQWQGLCLTIYGTRIVDENHSLSYIKKRVTIPSENGHFAAAANVLLTMLSLKQQATINYARFAAMLEEKQTIELETLCADHEYSLLRDDSVEGPFKSNIDMDQPMDQKVVDRILQRCKNVKVAQGLVSCKDWEKILVDDVKTSKSNKRQRR